MKAGLLALEYHTAAGRRAAVAMMCAMAAAGSAFAHFDVENVDELRAAVRKVAREASGKKSFETGPEIILQNGVYDLSSLPVCTNLTKSASRLEFPYWGFATIRSAGGRPGGVVLRGDKSARAIAARHNLRIVGIVFEGFGSEASGGVLAGNSIIAENCVFRGNSAAVDGGVATDGCFRGCTFDRNTAGRNGGALALGVARCALTNCIFRENTAYGSGGAVSVVGTHWRIRPRFVKCRFENNRADLRRPANGGAFDIAQDNGLPPLLEETTVSGGAGLPYGKRDGGFRCDRITVRPGDDLVKARDFLRAHRTPNGAAEVVFEDGVYQFTNGVLLTERDANVTWRAANPGKVTIVGGRSFRGNVFNPAGNGLVEWTVPAELRTNFLFRSLGGRPAFTHDTWEQPKKTARYPILTVDLRTMQLARWPNAPTYHWPKPEDVLRKASKGTNQVLRVADERVRKWNLDNADVWVYGFQGGCAYEQHPTPVLGYDRELGGFEFNNGRDGNAVNPGQVTRFFFLNVMEEIDVPGEWCYDRTRGVVRMMPPKGFNAASLVALGWMNEPLFRVEGSRIRLQGLTFTAFGVTPVVVVQGGTQCAVEGCAFSGLDLDGVFLSGTRNTVQSCDFRDVASVCVGVHGGKPKELVGGYNVVDNCRCENFCTMRESWGRGAIHIYGGVYNRASHNLVHGSTEHGLDYAGFGHVVEYNRIYDVSTEFGDSAATYSAGGFQSYGCVYRYNDVGSAPGYSMAYYADDFSSGHTVYGNIFRNYGYYGAFFGGGRDNVVSNNIFTAGWGGTRIDNRGLFWPAYKDVENIYTNVLVKKYDFENGPIAKKWPKFAEWHRRDGKMMCGYWDNVWCNNLFLDISGYSSSLFVARNRPITDTNRLSYVNNLIVRTKGLPKGWVEMERGAENVPTNEWGAANVVYLGQARILEGTPEKPIDLGFRDVPEAMWNAAEYMYLAQGWINVPKLQELREAGKTQNMPFRLGDFSQKPDARIAKEIPGWQEIPFAKIGLYKDRWRTTDEQLR